MERDLGNALERIEKRLAQIADLLESPVKTIDVEGNSLDFVGLAEQEHAEKSRRPTQSEIFGHMMSGRAKFVESVHDTPDGRIIINPVDAQGYSEPVSIDPIIDLCEQFVEFLEKAGVISILTSCGRDSMREAIGEFARVAKPLKDPMGSHENKLTDFLIWLRKQEDWEGLITHYTNSHVLHKYWESFQ